MRATLAAMKLKGQLRKCQSEMVNVILVVEEKGQPTRKTGRVRSCEADHVVFIDEMGKLHYIAYANIVRLEQVLDGGHWPTERGMA